MADDRAAQIARIEQIERIQKLESGNASPGVAAMGNTDGPTTAAKEKSFGQKLGIALNSTQAGFTQGVTAGYMPQMVGGVDAAGKYAGNVGKSALDMVGMAPEGFDSSKPFSEGVGDQYLKSRDQESKALKAAELADPVAYHAAQLGGIFGSAAKLPLAAASKSGVALRIAKAIGMGGAMGAAQNPGDKEGVIDPVQADARIHNAKVGAATGAVIAPLAEVGAEYGPQAFESLANSQAFKALGPYARAARQALAKGDVQSIGATARNEGVIGGMPTSFENIAKRAAAAKGARGEEIGQVLGELGQGEAAPTISRKEIADQLRTELIEPHTDVASIAKKNEQLSAAIDHFEKGGNENISLLDAEMKKRALDGQINWKRLPQDDVPVLEQGDKALRGKLMDAVETKAKEVNPEKAAQFGEAKDAYGNLDKAEQISKMRAGHEMAKTLAAPTIGGTLGFTQGKTLEERIQNAMMGAAGGLGIRAASLYGPQLVAPAAGKLSLMIPNASKLNPWLAPALTTHNYTGDE